MLNGFIHTKTNKVGSVLFKRAVLLIHRYMYTYLLSCAGEVIKEWSGDMKTEVRPQNKTMWREESYISLICST